MIACASCGHENPEDARFCNGCGATLGVVTASREERKVVSVVFADLVGSTELAAGLSPTAAEEVRRAHFALLRNAIVSTGGIEVKNLGDGLMLVFPSAPSAIRAALELLACAPPPLRLRAGLHTGDVVVTSDDLIGNAVNVAARVTALAKGGQVLVTAETLAAPGELSDVRVLRARRRALKGVTERTSVSRVERVGPL